MPFSVLLILILWLARVVLSTTSDTATFRGNLQHTGVYHAVGAPKLSAIKWKFQTQGQIYSSPAVAEGKVFFGSGGGNLYAVNSEDGTLAWKFASGGRIMSSPSIAAGIVYFESYDGNLYALDAADGRLKWKFRTGGEKRFAAKHIHGIDPPQEMMPDPFDFFLRRPSGMGSSTSAAGTITCTHSTLPPGL